MGYDKRDLDRCVEALGALDAPSFAVLGNHDHWTDGDRAKRAFGDSSIDLLTNEHRRVEVGEGAMITIVGVDDHVTKNADTEAAFCDLPAVDDDFCLVLNHVPAIAHDCIARGGHLVLSGHTHNFQFNIPLITNRLVKMFGAEYYAGPYRMDEGFLYINRGLGSASWPWRIRAMPELTLFTLRPGTHPVLELEHSEVICFDTSGGRATA